LLIGTVSDRATLVFSTGFLAGCFKLMTAGVCYSTNDRDAAQGLASKEGFTLRRSIDSRPPRLIASDKGIAAHIVHAVITYRETKGGAKHFDLTATGIYNG
jgi:hypothetical protein